ncbi:copper amine oxidase N-terminal domain-containing protein [Desulfovirgula thermocuniculi]|uniref:copper amine oxidase N-terminal domain-containing protein n=1 Tax=Desulfovirgula thermocuniculi TaxID=348842 RepID=UPI000404ECAF|nr:copper amine oxidase N-terminal domain-containing protein [Desulfovirgula thermocuniculi]
MKVRPAALLSMLLVFSLFFSGPAGAASLSGAAEGAAEGGTAEAEDVVIETVEEVSPREESPALIEAGPVSVEEAVYRAAALYQECREIPEAEKIYMAVQKLKEEGAPAPGHLVSLSRELYRFTFRYRHMLKAHPHLEDAVVGLTDVTVRLAYRFTTGDGARLLVYRCAAGTYAALGHYRRAARVLELALELARDRKRGYGELRGVYRKLGDRELKVFVRGKKQEFDVRPLLSNGRTLVPLRAISEALGARVDFNPAAQEVLINRGSINISLNLNGNVAVVNGKRVVLDEPARLVNSRTMVPLRFVSEALGAAVDYDQHTGTITVED